MVKMPKTLEQVSGTTRRVPSLEVPAANHPIQDPDAEPDPDLPPRPGTLNVDEVDDPMVRVQVLGDGHFINNHPVPTNAVIEIPLSEVETHREHGLQLGPVDDDYDGDVYDVHTEWQHPDNEPVENAA